MMVENMKNKSDRLDVKLKNIHRDQCDEGFNVRRREPRMKICDAYGYGCGIDEV